MADDTFSEEDFRELQRIAQTAALAAYPNPDRIGCPGTQVLREVANGALPSDHSAHEHVATCSPCLGEMLAFRSEFVRRRNKQINQRRILLFALAAVLVVLAALSRRTWWVTERSGSARQLRAVIPVNLAPYAITRGSGPGAADEAPVVQLPAKLVQLEITLPFGSDPGSYDIEVRKVSTNEVLKRGTGNARVVTGGVTRLENLRLDLSEVESGRYELFWKHSGATWHHVQIGVS